MQSLIITSVCGLYREFYHPAPGLLIHPETEKSDSKCLDANSLFWAHVLSSDTVHIVTERARTHFADLQTVPVAYRAALSDPKAFAKRVLGARTAVADHGLLPQEFFSYIETLNIYCGLYGSTFDPQIAPFSIQNGWMLSEESSESIFQNCLHEQKNPYLCFIAETILPIIQRDLPKVVFLSGRPGYFSFALARLLKSVEPSIFICITRHSSEYYSMNKIDFLLLRNSYLFQAFDAVILEHFKQTECDLVSVLKEGGAVNEVPNIIYRTENGGTQHTGYRFPELAGSAPSIERRPAYNESHRYISPDRVVNVHLFPYVKCYWNQCNFCGINQKYHFENPSEAYGKIEQQLLNLKQSVSKTDYIWFTDEAIPPSALGKIADFFIRELPGVKWQARCRIEPDLLSGDLPELLAVSGLRELRLGLESGSYTVLQSMHKFGKNFSFELVNQICQRYSSCGISIHFPMIIGFPGETEADRRASYDLLRRLTEEGPCITFNINLFGLDIGSNVFRCWYDFGIHSITFPCDPSFFLGNILTWNSESSNMEILSLQRDQFMRELLYPWMPAHPITPPHIFYRLSETSRNTLLWKERTCWLDNAVADNALLCQVKTGDLTIFYDSNKDIFYIYSWNSHHFMIGGQFLVRFLKAFELPDVAGNILETFLKTTPNSYSHEDLIALTRRLIHDQYLIVIDETPFASNS